MLKLPSHSALSIMSSMKKTFNCSFLIVLFAMVCTCSILPALSQSSDGKKLLIKHACANCHLIEGQGGFIGPPLDGIGAHRDENYIIYKLTVRPLPRRKKLFPVPYELMSHVHVPDADAASIAKYLRSLPAKTYQVQGHGKVSPDEVPAGSAFRPDKESASSKKGMQLFREKGCFACHSVGGLGGTKGPSLQGVGARRSRKFISNRIVSGAVILPEPTEKSGTVSMPALKLSDAEIKSITDWLMTLPLKSN